MAHHVAEIWGGGPGEGKSSIAREAGCRLWDAGQCLGGCFLVDCKGATKDELMENFVAERLVPPIARCQGGCWVAPANWETARKWMQMRSAKGVLLVFENNEDALRDKGSAREELRGRDVMVLVTSRRSLGITLGRATQLKLRAMPLELNTEVLMTLAGDEVLWGDGEATELVEICGGNALAITILAGFLRDEWCKPKAQSLLGAINCRGIREICESVEDDGPLQAQ
ncbi:hypothetical protein WJX81_000644 [Elliptochloris bilobata]|uniref:NB-ARC domain-containing protein n=1 Tax=Elliptochloris bilobata TaxID=381761 RepID=A0AAW1R3L2_9CHLO